MCEVRKGNTSGVGCCVRFGKARRVRGACDKRVLVRVRVLGRARRVAKPGVLSVRVLAHEGLSGEGSCGEDNVPCGKGVEEDHWRAVLVGRCVERWLQQHCAGWLRRVG